MKRHRRVLSGLEAIALCALNLLILLGLFKLNRDGLDKSSNEHAKHVFALTLSIIGNPNPKFCWIPEQLASLDGELGFIH